MRAGGPREVTRFSLTEVLDVDFPLSRSTIEALEIKGLQCGCGGAIRRQWLNSDFMIVEDQAGNETSPGQLVRLDGDRYYLQHDAIEPFPIEDGSLDCCYSEHFIEHLEPDEGVGWLAEMRRLLRPGGTLRVSTPDQRRYVEGYFDPDGGFFAEHRERIAASLVANRSRVPGLPELADAAGLERPCFMVNQIFVMWGHKWVYDFGELRHAAVAAGFSADKVTRHTFREGAAAGAAAIDLPFRNDESIYVEMQKA